MRGSAEKIVFIKGRLFKPHLLLAERSQRDDRTEAESPDFMRYRLDSMLGELSLFRWPSCTHCHGERALNHKPELIQSPLNQSITRKGHALWVNIYRLEDDDTWLLEMVNELGTSHVWDDRFASDQDALNAVQEALGD